MRLQDLFKGSSPTPKKILSDATRALEEQDAGNLAMDAEGAQLVGKLLGKCVPKGGVTVESVAAAAALAKLVHLAPRKKSRVTEALLTGPAARALCDAVAAAARALDSGRLDLDDVIEPLEQLLSCVDHLRGLSFKRAATDDDGWGAQVQDKENAVVKVRGRPVMAPYAVPALLDVILLVRNCEPDGLEDILPLVKTAAETLAYFFSGPSAEGAAALAGARAAGGGAALDAVLFRCGDAPMQLDLCEAMYKCIRAIESAEGLRNGAAPTLNASALYKPLKELVFKSERGEGVYLPTDLRQVLYAFNRRAGKGALVASLAPAAPEAAVCGATVAFAPGSYVDLGQVSLALSLLMNAPQDGGNLEPDSQGGSQGEAVPSEIYTVEIPYRIVSGCTISSSAVAGAVSLALQLSELPDGLPEAVVPLASAAGRPMVVLALRAADVVHLKETVPLVAAPVQRAGIKLPSGEADLSQPGRVRKMSMAIAGRPLAPPAGPAPGAKGKAKGPIKTSVLEQAERARADSRQGQGKTASVATAAATAPAQTAKKAPAAGANQRKWRNIKLDTAPAPSTAATAANTAAGSVKPAPSRKAPPPASDPIEEPSPDSPVHKAPAARITLLGGGAVAAETPGPAGGAAEGLEDWMAELQPKAPLPSPLVDESDSDDDGEFAGNEAFEKGAAAARGESPGAMAAPRAVAAPAVVRAAKTAAADPKAPYKNPVQQKQREVAAKEAAQGGKAAGAGRRAAPATKGKAKPAGRQLKAVAAAGAAANKKTARPAKPAAKAAAAAAAAAEVAAPVERRQTRTRAAAAAKSGPPQKETRRSLEASDDDDEDEDMPPAEQQLEALQVENEQFGGDGAYDGGYGGGGDEMDLEYDDMILSQRQDAFTASHEREEAAAAAAAKTQARADADAILGKRTPKGGAKKPRKGRMAALGGPGAAKKVSVSPLADAIAAAAPAAALPARTPARLQTETPAVAVGKKKDAGSDPVKTKRKTAAAAAAAVVPRMKRAAAQKASKKLAQERDSDDEGEEEAEPAEAAEGEVQWAVLSDIEEVAEEDAGWGANDEAEDEEEDAVPLCKQPSPRRPAPRKKAPAPKAAAPAPKAPAAPKPKPKPSKPAAPPPPAVARPKAAPVKAAAAKAPASALALVEKEVSDGESSEYSLHGSDTDSGAGRAAQQLPPAIGVGAGVGIGATAVPLRAGRGRAATAYTTSSDEQDDAGIETEEEDEDGGDGGEAAAHFALPPTTARALKQGKKQAAAAANDVMHETYGRGLAQTDQFIAELRAGTAARLDEARRDAVGGVKEAENAAKAKLEDLAEALADNQAAAVAALATFTAHMAGLEGERARLEAEAAAVEQEVERMVGEARQRGKRRLHEAFDAVKGEAERGRKRVKEIIAEAVQEGQRAVLDMFNGVFYGVKEGAKNLCG